MSRALPRALNVSSRSCASRGPARLARHGHEVRCLSQLHLRLRQILRHQELLNVEQLGRPRPFPILLAFRLQGGVRSNFGRVFRS